MKFKKSIVGLINTCICFSLTFNTAYAGVDDDVNITNLDLGFEITSYATSVEQVEVESGLSYSLLSSSNESYVYFHRNINSNLTSFDGIFFDIENPSYEKILLSLTLSPGIGSISSVRPTTNVGQITYVEKEEGDGFFDDDFWHKDTHGGDGHYDKEVEDDGDSDDDSSNLNIKVKNDITYFTTQNNSNYFTASAMDDSNIVIPAGFDGRIYIPFSNMEYVSNSGEIELNNISSMGFTIVTTNGLSQNIIFDSYGSYNYVNNHLLDQANNAKIIGQDELSIPAVGVNSTKQEVSGLDGVDYNFELITSDSNIVLSGDDTSVILAYPRALDGSFDIRVWVNEVVCIQKTILCSKIESGISGVTDQSVVRDTAYITNLLYIGELVSYYRYFFLIIPIIFVAIVLLVLNSNKKSKE